MLVYFCELKKQSPKNKVPSTVVGNEVFFSRLAGITIHDRVRSSTIQQRLRVKWLLSKLRVARQGGLGSFQRCALVSCLQSCIRETPRAHSEPTGLYITVGLEMSVDPPGSRGICGQRGEWADLLAFSHCNWKSGRKMNEFWLLIIVMVFIHIYSFTSFVF